MPLAKPARGAHTTGVPLRRLLSLLLLVAFAMGLGEDLLVRADAYALHVVCPEHGELVHAAVGDTSNERSLRQAPDAEPHGVGCELAALGNAPPALQAPAIPTAVAQAEARPLPPAPLIDPDIVVALVLGYAPKTSPPIA